MRNLIALLASSALIVSAPAFALDDDALTAAPANQSAGVPLSTLSRYGGLRDTYLVGTGIVVGLSGSGDTRNSDITRMALQSVFSRLGITVGEDDISSRNVAVVLVTATLPASANAGDPLDVRVQSAGDARSLSGGALLMTPLVGPDGVPYALAQGPLLTNADRFDAAGGDLSQRNYPTSGTIIGGGLVERPIRAQLLDATGALRLFVDDPNPLTATRIADAINVEFGVSIARAVGGDEVRIQPAAGTDITRLMARLETVRVQPARVPRIIVNERSGTIVAGGEVTISSVVISQDDIRITVVSDVEASQPAFISGIQPQVSSLVLTNTELSVDRGEGTVVASFPDTTVADLIAALSEADVDARRTISVLQAMKAAGALNAEIITQ